MALATVSGNENYTMCIQDIAIGDQGIFDKISQVKCTVIAADASARDLQPTNLFKIEGKWKADLGIKLSPNVTLKMQIYRLFLPVFSRHPNSAVTQLQGTDIHRWLHALPTSKKEGRHDMPWTLDLGPGRKKLNILIGLDVVINPPIRTPSSLLSEKHENELLDKLGNRNQPPGLLLADHTLQKGTRRKQLLHISEWIKGRAETQSNVLLLVGALGTGKTCIVSKVWTELKKDKTRSSALLCLTDDRAKNLDRVSNNLALVIADAYPAFRTSLCRILDSSFTSTHSGIPEVLEKILTAFASIPLEEQIPLVVIVDATANFYDPHFPKIVESWAELPSCFKLLVTARPHEGSSQAVAEKKAEYLELHSGAGRSDEDDSDIAIFLEDKLSQLAPKKYASVAEPWPGKHIISKLVQDSAGLFSWAYAIVSSIGATHDQDRDEQLAKVVLDSTSAKYCDESFGDILDSISLSGSRMFIG
ncbi:hypothetical protein OF83DRAFT_463659 [Amylostereum chailletii]|nr:hypothetical protein OF83DRAFT_463659 [Amylostereum chailletii]